VSGSERIFTPDPIASPPGAGLPAAIIEQIQSAIFRDELRVGDRLPPERDLAALFGVSRPTVREALRALQLVGLLEFRQGSNGGGIVASSADGFLGKALVLMYRSGAFTLAQMYAARALLEPMLIEHLLDQADGDAVIRGLRAEVASAEASYYRGEVRRGLVVDFHGRLAKSVANPALSLLASSLVTATLDINAVYAGVQPNVEELLECHRRIAMLMARRDVAAAKEAMSIHLAETSDFYAHLEKVSRNGQV
jgi:DNA-binding FadR family transcriptional regulator